MRQTPIVRTQRHIEQKINGKCELERHHVKEFDNMSR